MIKLPIRFAQLFLRVSASRRAATAVAAEKPDVVYILADDVGVSLSTRVRRWSLRFVVVNTILFGCCVADAGEQDLSESLRVEGAPALVAAARVRGSAVRGAILVHVNAYYTLNEIPVLGVSER